MAVRLSALLVSHALPPERSTGAHFCYRLSKLQGKVWLEGLGELKKFSDLIRT
jgi:hypothetical protein